MLLRVGPGCCFLHQRLREVRSRLGSPEQVAGLTREHSCRLLNLRILELVKVLERRLRGDVASTCMLVCAHLDHFLDTTK